MWNSLKQKQTIMLAALLLFAGVGVVAITAVNYKNDNKGKDTIQRVEAEPSEEEDATTTSKAEDGHVEPKGVSETSGPVYGQNDTSMVNPSVPSTTLSFASVTTTSVVVELEPEQEETPIQLARADGLNEQVAVMETPQEDEGKKVRSFEGAVSVPETQDVNEEEGAKRIEKAKKAEEEAKKAEEEARALAEAEAEAKAKAEEALRIEEEERIAVQKAADDEKAKKEAEEAARKAEEERIKAEEEAKKAEEEARKAEEEAKKKAEEEARALAEAEALVQMLHSEQYEGNVYNGDDTYPWQADCPDKQDYYLTYMNGSVIGGYVCECVSYAGWKAYEVWGVPISWGNANSWDDRARADARFYVDNTPAAKTIGQVDGGLYGHVFWVESVNPDGSVNVTEYNNAYATMLYLGVYRFGDFGARTIPASEVEQYNYIHLR